MSRTLEALKRAQEQRFSQPPQAPAAADAPPARPPRRAGRPGGVQRAVWVAVGVLALLAVLSGWWAFGPSLTVKVGTGGSAAAGRT